MHAQKRYFLTVTIFLLLTAAVFADAKIYEKQLTIPTYGIDAPDPNPRFFDGRVYQGAQGRIYPYPISDVLTNELADKDYNAVYLENDFIKICVLPEIGGRIFEAVDKTNGYNFFYKQSVIKPSLIGMLGAWMSGGVEWNFPHHHRANTVMPMDYVLKENEDGSKTLWLTEIEQRHRMKMLIGLTIWPDRNVLQAELKFFNRTPFVHSFLYFANPAVHVDSTYQVIFPPEVEYVTQHAKREFAQWPIADNEYGGFDYNNTDISWWKNLPKPVSFFAWDHSSDYFAGYDHGKDAGVAYVANVHLAPGKKFFTFGHAEQGQMWDKMLTDADGPYLELMAGAYSDNQPDYSWIQPYETKIIKQSWFPIRNLGGMTYANTDGAIYFETRGNKAQLNILTTAVQNNALVTLSAKDEILWEQKFDISPSRVFQTTIKLSDTVRETDLTITVRSEKGRKLLSYKPAVKPNAPMPKPVTPPENPDTYKTNEELYLTGLRLDEFHNPQIDAFPYYNEALRRDSSDARVNTQLGILYCKRGMRHKAEEHLQRAVDRLTFNYTRPKNGEAHYYLGVAQRALKKYDRAYDSFYRAAWNFAWRAASFYELAELDCLNDDFKKALDHINEALVVNVHNMKAHNLKCAILRQMGKPEQAKQTNDLVHTIDPLDYWALNEFIEIQKSRIQGPSARQAKIDLLNRMKGDVQLSLELATDYGNAGFYREAVDVLKRLSNNNFPLVSYYIAYYSHLLGNEDIAAYFLIQASMQPPDFCFPYRLETVDILLYAIEQQPQDAHAFYYLGNQMMDHQPERAIQLWQNAVYLDPELSIAHRNLGLGLAQMNKDISEVIFHYEQAINYNKNDARLFYELDILYESINKYPNERLALLLENKKTVMKRDDALARLTELQVLTGDYDAAIATLTSHHFNVWEGGGDIHNVFVDAHLLRGLNFYDAKQYDKAAHDFTTALDYPDNLEVGRPLHDMKTGRTYFFLGRALENVDKKRAQKHFELAATVDARDYLLYYQGRALLKLNQADKARAIFDRMIEQGEKQLQQNQDVDFFAKFGEKNTDSRRTRTHFLTGLGYYGKGDRTHALAEMEKAQQIDINNVWVNHYVELLTQQPTSVGGN